VVANGSPDLRFDLIGGGLVDARSDARDPIEPRKLIFKIRREIIIKMTAPALWVRILRMITSVVGPKSGNLGQIFLTFSCSKFRLC
jgi:hypothetical protein